MQGKKNKTISKFMKVADLNQALLPYFGPIRARCYNGKSREVEERKGGSKAYHD
jgi:hypothetical protein